MSGFSLRHLRLFLALLLLAALFPGLQDLSAQGITWNSALDWETGILELMARAPIDRSGANAPAAAHRAEQEVESELTSAVVDALAPLRIDSRATMAGRIQESPTVYQRLAALADGATRAVTRPDRTLTTLEVTYRLNLYPGVSRLLLRDDLPLPFPRILGWVASGEYTGLVIYAADPLPLHGTDLTTTIEPALFPAIYDEQMGDVLTRDNLDANFVQRWGVAAYTDSLDLSPFTERIGENPKHILARRLFGIAPTDLVISSRDARELLMSESNRRLLQEGRIVIVTPPPMD